MKRPGPCRRRASVGLGLEVAGAESAHKNLGDRENVQIVQANLLKLPFPDQTFDFIYSIGVLHLRRRIARRLSAGW